MTIEEIAKDAMKQAEEETKQIKAEEPKAPTETIDDYITRMVKEHPQDVVSNGEFPETTIIPGFSEVNLGLAAIYGIKWGALEHLIKMKGAYQPHLIPTQIGIHFVRGFSRLEWGSLQQKIVGDTKDRLAHHEAQGTDQKWKEIDINLRTEEMIACAGCVDPSYSRETIRKIPSGIVSYLANSIILASGYDSQPLPPLPLK